MMKIWKQCILPIVLIFLLTACGASGGVCPSADDKIDDLPLKVETEHFKVYCEGEDAETASGITQMLEGRYDELLTLFETTLTAKTTILIFPDRDTFRAAVVERGVPEDWEMDDRLGGVTVIDKENESQIFLLSGRVFGNLGTQEACEQTALHEFIHIIVGHINPNLSSHLLGEGIATYMSGQKESLKVETNMWQAYQFDLIYPAEDLDRMYDSGETTADVHIFGCSFVEYIVETYGFDSLLALIRETGDWDYEAIFGVSPEEFHQGWISFVAENY